MNWQALLKTLLHCAIGAAASTVAGVVADPHVAITAGTILLPALASGATRRRPTGAKFRVTLAVAQRRAFAA